MKMFSAGGLRGCILRRELFGDYAMAGARQCDGIEWNGELVQDALQRPQRVIETYVANDIV